MEQRGPRAHSRPPSRRRFLEGGAALAAGFVAGCTGRASTGRSSDSRSRPVSILAAGSLNNALENGLGPALDAPLHIEAHGSATVARLVAEGQRDPDLVSVADVALFEQPLSPPWFVEFATNAMVVAYNPESEGGRLIAEAGPDGWYRPLTTDEVSLGRTDPDLDPLGYRTRFVLELASRYYDVPNLAERVLLPDQRFPETELLSQFETGAIDVAFAYRSMAVERGYEWLELPAEIDLSNPRYADEWYSAVSYTLPSGHRIEGAPISFATWRRHAGEVVDEVFTHHVQGAYLEDFGFTVPPDYPRTVGATPGED